MNFPLLPVYRHKDLILKALETSQAIVVESPTGSGKTTQLPVILHDAGYGKNGIIGVTQPRRIAALSVSEFIARQTETELGGLVGYKMRFEDKTSRDTKIKIMTDGILLQEMKLDPWLSKYGCLVVDEAHERSLNIDFILGLLKRVLEERKEFKVIVSSATINAEVFSEYFEKCPVVKIDSVIYPVTMIYDPPLVPASSSSQFAEEALLEKINFIIERIIGEKREGHILVFLPGEKAIKDCMARLSAGKAGPHLHLLPLYGRLGKEEQERVFDEPPKGKIKVIVSTNIAETSVTIDGVTAVLDSGLSKLNYYNPHTFTSSLVEAPVSKASANQRKGRAGRTGEGNCYRLYNRKEFENRPLFTTEEIYRTDLSEVVLRMADLGITVFEEFDFISPPNREGLIAAIETLKLLDALEDDRTLSRTGQLMTEFPLAPRHSRIIVEAILKYPEVIRETIIAAAFLSTQSPYILPPGEETDARKAHHAFRDPGGDFVSYLKLLYAYNSASNRKRFCEKNYLDERAMAEIANVTVQLEEIVSEMKIPLPQGTPASTPSSARLEDYLCCVARGLIQFVCVREDGRSRERVSHALYRSLTADRILIHPGSVMFKTNPKYIVAGEIVLIARTYAMSVSPLSYNILEKTSNGLFEALAANEAGYEAGRRHRGQDRIEKSKRIRDFTDRIKIGDEIFNVETVKGKKQVKLPWENLARLKDGIGPETASLYRRLKGVVVVKGEYTLLEGERLSLILTLAPSLDPLKAWEKKPVPPARFNSGENLDELLKQLPHLVKEALLKHKGKKSGKGAGSKELGFTTLFTDGRANYWIKCSKGFHTSLNESLASVEALIDELGEEIDIEKKHTVNQSYRRLSDLLG